eukprot:Pompholyxophrys_sp_v1_NODE_19_length_4057_cov_7.699150.p3 type:complete len:142 gc:universal NODE_19_length_4057_cov_7.699150:431-856(+)
MARVIAGLKVLGSGRGSGNVSIATFLVILALFATGLNIAGTSFVAFSMTGLFEGEFSIGEFGGFSKTCKSDRADTLSIIFFFCVANSSSLSNPSWCQPFSSSNIAFRPSMSKVPSKTKLLEKIKPSACSKSSSKDFFFCSG